MSSTIIDDADGAVVYSGKWYAATGFANAYSGTMHVSSTLNDRAVLTFQGTGVLVNSGQEGVNWRVQSSYTIDGGSPTVYSNNTMQSSTEAFRSPTLPNGQHTLTVINLDSRGVSLFLDSFIVFTDSGTGSGSTSSPSNPTTSSTSTATTPVTDSSSHASSSGPTASTSTAVHLPAVTMASSSTIPHNASIPTSSAATKSNDSSQIPLIVGPIFGAIFFCGILYSLVLLRRRRKRKELNEPIATPISYAPIPLSAPMRLKEGQKPSAFRSLNEPPPYIEDSQASSHSIIAARQPAKFRT